MHLRSLERFEFASVLFPYNHSLLSDPGYRADVERLIEVADAGGVALQTIKAIARRRWGPEPPKGRRSWYEPLEDRDALTRAVRFVLGRPGLFLLTSSDYRRLPEILEAATGPATPPDEAELAGDEARLDMAPIFDGGTLERI